MNKLIKFGLAVLSVVILLLLATFLIRLFSPSEIDDVNPVMCSDSDWKYIQKSDILWVVPDFDNKSINENKSWINSIKEMNKTLGLHGVYHTYNEFGANRDSKYVLIGKSEFESAFGFSPVMFKPPQLAMNSRNREMLEDEGFVVKGKWNQFFHKVYHCNDTGMFSNRIIDWF